MLDGVDGDILVPAGLADPTYQLIDKIADYGAYIFMVLWAWHRPVRKEAAGAFVLRSLGQMSFFATRDERTLFFFPNLLEPLFLIYATLERFKGREEAHEVYRRRRVLIWLFIVAYKLQDEWITHIANVDRTETLRALVERLQNR